MKAVIQRVSQASVTIDSKIKSKIKNGLLIYIAILDNDTNEIAKKFAKKILNMRIFEDDFGKMNKSLLEMQYEILVISQFTLYADCKKGNRPFFGRAGTPEIAEKIYLFLCEELSKHTTCKTGEFAAMMSVDSINEGPVTIILDSDEII